MELSAILWKSDTSELERTAKVIAGLATDLSKLDKVSRDAAKTEETLAKAAKSNADANLQNAKAQDVRLKSTIAADKADQANEKSTTAKTKAVESHTKATKENVGILQRQTDIYDFLAAGFSKGQASILASAKATGQLSDELKKVLEAQKQFSSDPFDRSDTGLKRLQRTIKEVTDAQGYFNDGYSLTTKQARELSNDLDRLNASLKSQGKSYQDITKAQAIYKQQFLDEAAVVNRANAALDMVTKQRKEVVTSTNYVTQADQRMAAALNISNAALDKGGTDSLVKYEMALRKSGIAQDLIASKLATYKTQIAQVQAAEGKRAEAHLMRASSPQLTDLAVSLYSGQAPLTVLLQQGGQLADQLRLSGVEATRFGAILKESFYSMIPVIKQVGVGLTGLVTGMFIDAGKAITGFIGNITGISAAMDIAKRAIASGGEENFKYIGSIQKIGTAFSALAGIGIAAVITALVTLGLEYKKILQSESELSVALATSGGALGLSKDQAVQYAQGMQSIGVGTLKAQEAIVEFAKAGKVGKDSLDLIIKSAVELEKTAGVAIGETAKQFAKLQDAPTKTLTEIAEKTGLVDASTLDLVRSLEQQGQKAQAASIATVAFASTNVQAAAEIRSNWSPLEVLWNDIKSVLGKVKQEIYDITTSNRAVGAFRTVWETVAVVVSQVWFTLKGVGTEIGGIAAQIGAVMRGDFAGAKSIGEQMKIDAQAAREEQDKLITSLLTRGQVEDKQFNKNKQQQSEYAAWLNENEKALAKALSKKEQFAIKETQLKKDLNSGLINEVKYNEALAGWKRVIFGYEKNKNSGKQTQKDLETEIDILNKRAGLASSYNNELESLQRLRAKGLITEEEYIHDVEELIRLQPFYLDQQKKINDAHELSNKLIGKQDMLGRDYYKTLEKIDEYQKMGVENGGYSVEHAEKLRQAAYDQTELAKTRIKIEESSAKLVEKYKDDTEKSLKASTLENANLDDRLDLLGLTSEQQKKLRIEQERRNKLLAIDLKLQTQIQEVWEKWGNGDFGVNGATKAKAVIKELTEQAGVDAQLVNKETAVKFREDFDREFSKIKDGISDSIVTALFEGGKAGKDKLRNVIVDALKRPITLTVNAVVNTLMNNALGAVLGGSAGQAGGSALGSAGGSLMGSALGGIGAFGTGASYGATSLFANGLTGTLAAGGQMIGAGSVMSGLGTIAGALGPITLGIGLLSSLIKKSTPHTGGIAGYSEASGMSTGASVGLAFGIDERHYTKAGEDVAGGVSKAIVQMLDQTASTFGKQAGYSAASAFADDSSKDGAWGALRIKFGEQVLLDWADTAVRDANVPREFADGEAGSKEYLAAVAVSARDALSKSIGDVEWAQDMLKALGDSPSLETLSQAVQQINTAKQALDQMGKNLVNFGAYTDSAVSALIKASGGLDGLIASANTYYENFYTEAERAANTTRDVAEALAEVGLEMPKTREGYRALVEQQQKLGESGTESVAVLLKLSGAFASITEAAGETVTEVQALAKAERERMQAARESANKLVEEQTKSFKNLQDSLSKEAFKSKGGMAYGFNVSISEVQSSEKFITALDSATASLAELEKLNLGSEFEKYASEISEVVQGTKELFAAQLANSRLSQGNVSGAIHAKMGASQLNYSDFTENGQFKSGAFNVAYAREQAIAAKGLVDVANSNALTTSNVASVIGQLNTFAQSELILNEIKQGFIQGVREASNTTSTYVVRDAVQSLADVFAKGEANSQFLNTSTGLPAIASAYAAAADTQKVQMIDGARYMGEFSISYASAISNLNASFNRSKITADELEGAVKALEASFGELKDYAVTPADIAMSRIGASSNIATEGIKALNLYFGQLTERAGELAEQAKLASEPIAVVTDVIGRMTSFTDVFATSANAVIDGFKGMTGAVGAMQSAIAQMQSEGVVLSAEQTSALMADAFSSANMGEQGLRDALTYGSQVRKGLLVSQAASIAGSTMTTADASKVAEKIQENPAFAKLTQAGIRDASMLLDGLKQFDASSFEKVFVRISEAFNQGALNEEQYAALFDESINIFTDHDAKIKQVTDSFNTLRDAAKSLADQLLIDAGYTSLTGSQTLDEAQRQYNAVLLRALGGDVTAASDLSGITQQMLDIAKQQATDESTYNRLFGATISDLRTVESLQTPKAISEPIKVNAESNAELIEQIKLLREEIRASNAQIASNTDKTNKSLQEFQVNGMPTVALV